MAIKTLADTNRAPTKASKPKKTKEEENVNRAGEGANKADEALVTGAYGACNVCNKKGHFKMDCPDHKEKLLKKFKEAKGEKWMSPKSYAEGKKAQKGEGRPEWGEGNNLSHPSYKWNVNATQLFDKN